MDKKVLGSQTAKGGFANEHKIVEKFNAWEKDKEAQLWLEIMGYDLKKLSVIKCFNKIKRIFLFHKNLKINTLSCV